MAHLCTIRAWPGALQRIELELGIRRCFRLG